MNRPNELHEDMVSFSLEEIAALPRLPRAGRDMTDAEITAAAMEDPDTPNPLDFAHGEKRGREALLEHLPASLTDELLKFRGRPPVENPKQKVSIRLSPDVLAHFRAQGRGWQTRIDETLRAAIGHNNAGT